MKKCIHKREKDFCCECRYGDINKLMRKKEEMPRDSVSDLNMPIKYKLVAGHMGDTDTENNGLFY